MPYHYCNLSLAAKAKNASIEAFNSNWDRKFNPETLLEKFAPQKDSFFEINFVDFN